MENRHPIDFLHPLPIIEWKWDVLMINFITKLHKKIIQNDSIMVVVGKLTKVAHFILVKTTHKETNIVDIYMKEATILHGILKVIVSNIHAKFTSNFWKELFEGFRTNMNMSTTYHPHTDG